MSVSLELVKSLDTPQKMFDHVAKHLFEQGKPAVVEVAANGTHCRYRTAKGDMCAAGCVIPDSYYNTVFEGDNISAVLVFSKMRELLGDFRTLLQDLQVMHDGMQRDVPFNTFDLYEGFVKVALKNSLSLDFVRTLKVKEV